MASTQESTPQERGERSAETSLIGVNILSTGMSLIMMFGSPNDVLPLSVGGGGVGPGGGFGGGGGTQGPAGDGGPSFAGAGGGGGGATADARLFGDPFSMNRGLNQSRPGQVPGRGAPPPGTGQGPAVPGNRAGGGGGGVGGGAASATRVLFTRWVYRIGSSRYAFVLDKFNRVVQIEAMGLSDSKVFTSQKVDGKNITFGATFADIITAYNVPDAYEISGDTIVMRYLVRDHVAFRLSRLRPGGPHQVTGIVVAAGKA